MPCAVAPNSILLWRILMFPVATRITCPYQEWHYFQCRLNFTSFLPFQFVYFCYFFVIMFILLLVKGLLEGNTKCWVRSRQRWIYTSTNSVTYNFNQMPLLIYLNMIKIYLEIVLQDIILFEYLKTGLISF